LSLDGQIVSASTPLFDLAPLLKGSVIVLPLTCLLGFIAMSCTSQASCVNAELTINITFNAAEEVSMKQW
jgi:hypothetical protein